MKILNKINTKVSLGLVSLAAASPAIAGGLDDATSAITEIKTWAYGFLGVAVFLFLMYKVGMALADKEPWADVMTGLGKVAAAGGIIVAGEWAWAIFV